MNKSRIIPLLVVVLLFSYIGYNTYLLQPDSVITGVVENKGDKPSIFRTNKGGIPYVANFVKVDGEKLPVTNKLYKDLSANTNYNLTIDKAGRVIKVEKIDPLIETVNEKVVAVKDNKMTLESGKTYSISDDLADYLEEDAEYPIIYINKQYYGVEVEQHTHSHEED